MADEHKDDDEKVGPGHPPKEHRWKKGGPSPNPRGRPPKKGLKEQFAELDRVAEMVERFGSRMVASPDGPIELRESHIRVLTEMAYNPNTSGKLRLDILKHLGALDRDAYAVIKEEGIKQFNIALDHKERWTAVFRRAEAKGQKPPPILPHPDDVIIRGGRVMIVGPMTPGDQDVLKFRLFERKTFTELFDIHCKAEPSEQRLRDLKYCRRRLAKVNKEVPPRLRLPVPRLPDDITM